MRRNSLVAERLLGMEIAPVRVWVLAPRKWRHLPSCSLVQWCDTGRECPTICRRRPRLCFLCNEALERLTRSVGSKCGSADYGYVGAVCEAVFLWVQPPPATPLEPSGASGGSPEQVWGTGMLGVFICLASRTQRGSNPRFSTNFYVC